MLQFMFGISLCLNIIFGIIFLILIKLNIYKSIINDCVVDKEGFNAFFKS